MAAGFVDFDLLWQGDIYADAPQASSARKYGTVGITFRARRALSEAEWLAAVAALSCEVPAVRS